MSPSFGSVVLKPLYACTYLDHNISLVLAVTTAPLITLGMSQCIYYTQVIVPYKQFGHSCSLMCRSFRCHISCHGVWIGRSRPPPFSSLPRSTLSWFSPIVMANGLRETETAFFSLQPALFDPVLNHDNQIKDQAITSSWQGQHLRRVLGTMRVNLIDHQSAISTEDETWMCLADFLPHPFLA